VVEVEAHEVGAVVSFQIIVAGGLVWGSGDFRVRDQYAGKELTMAPALKPHFKALMQAVAEHLGAQLGEIGESEGPVFGSAGLPTSASRPGRA
jgi:hypothetical protein